MKFIKNNMDRIIFCLVLLILVCCIGVYVVKTLSVKEHVKEAKIIDEIVDYGYYLNDMDSDLYASIFKDLKANLTSSDINEEEYAKSIALLFAIDFYTLDNKFTNMDIGGIEFLDPSIKDNFISKASDTVYKHIKNNLYGNRNQELPVVSKATIDSITYDELYNVDVKLSYAKDMEYPENMNIVIVNKDNKLVIIEVK